MRSPDMKRLCEAVEIVCDHHGMMAVDEDHEAIVRAVLTELREPSEAMIEAIVRQTGTGYPDARPEAIALWQIALRSATKREWRTGIDVILSEAPDA